MSKKILVKDMSKTSTQEQMECYNSGWQDGYTEALVSTYTMLASVEDKKDVKAIMESIRKTLEHEDV